MKPREHSDELPRWASVLIVMALLLLFVWVGTSLIHWGCVGHSPVKKLSPGQAKIAILAGVLFAYPAIVGMVVLIWGGRCPPVVERIGGALFLVVLGLLFLAIPFFDPSGISCSASVDATVRHPVEGSSAGSAVFMAFGIGCLAGAFWFWRRWKRKGQ